MKAFKNLLFSILLCLWFYYLAFFQFSQPFNLNITFVLLGIYLLLYIGMHKHIVHGKIRHFLALGAFTLTFSIFWSNIIYILFFLADLLPGKSPFIFVLNAIIHAPLYVLFYKKLTIKQPVEEVKPRTTLHFILEITFPILIAIAVFIGTLFFYTQLQYSIILNYPEGLTILMSVVAVTIIETMLTAHLFEDWLRTAERRSLEKVITGFMIVGVLLTMLLIRNMLS